MLKINHAICPECSVGCGINVISKDGKLVGINPYKNHPVNQGKNCKNCIDNIENLAEYDQEKSFDYDAKLSQLADTIKNYSNNEITVITSGKTDNDDLEKIISFTQEKDYNLLAYENNFKKTDKELMASYEDVENADNIITVGDIFRNNTLAARKIIHAQEKGAKTSNINTTKNLTGYNCDKFTQIDSFKNLADELKTQEITDNTVLLINEVSDYDEIIEFVKENNIKILPLPKNPNSYSILEKIEKTSKDEIADTINESKVLLFINEDVCKYKCCNLDDKTVISITQKLSGKVDEIPVRFWCEKEGSFTNAEGCTQEFSDAINDENNNLKTVGEVIEIISNNI